MTTYAWPARAGFFPQSLDMWMLDNDIITRSVLGGGQQTGGVPGGHWRAAFMFSKDNSDRRQDLLGFLRGLNGKEHRVALYDMRKFSAAGVQGSPGGTINTSGVTLNATAGQWATSVQLAGCGNATTLKPGDMLSINGQLIENPELATASAGGLMTVRVPHRLRRTAVAATPVTLVKPTALFVLAEPFHGPRIKPWYEDFAVEFEEVFA